jgi:hypothetical protein
MAKRSAQRNQQQQQSRWWSNLPGWLQGVAALLTALVATAAAFGILNQSDQPPANTTLPTRSTPADPEVFISSVTATYGKDTTAAGSGDSSARREPLPDAIEVTGRSRHVSPLPLPPHPARKRTPVIVAAAQYRSSPRGLWLVSDPATVSLNGEWFATIRLRSTQSRMATLTVVALVVPYDSVESVTGGGGAPGGCLPEDKPCPTGTQSPPTRTQPPPTSSPSAVERHGPRMTETIAKSAEKILSLERR